MVQIFGTLKNFDVKTEATVGLQQKVWEGWKQEVKGTVVKKLLY